MVLTYGTDLGFWYEIILGVTFAVLLVITIIGFSMYIIGSRNKITYFSDFSSDFKYTDYEEIQIPVYHPLTNREYYRGQIEYYLNGLESDDPQQQELWELVALIQIEFDDLPTRDILIKDSDLNKLLDIFETKAKAYIKKKEKRI
jgi:hypothetical protein